MESDRARIPQRAFSAGATAAAAAAAKSAAAGVVTGAVMDGADLLTSLPAIGFGFLLVFCRCAMALALLPAFGETDAPAILRLGMAFTLTLLVYPGIGTVAVADAWQTAGMVVAELAYGALLGGLARLVTLALPMAGQIASFMLGLSSVIQPDALLGQSSALMRLGSITAPVLILNTGLWALPVAALANSYSLAPAGAIPAATDGVQAMSNAVSQCVSLAVQLAAPFICASVVWQVALGLIARLVPHLQVYSAAMPAQIAAGLILFGLLGTTVLGQWTVSVRQSFITLPAL